MVQTIYPNPNDGSMWLQYSISVPGMAVIYTSAGTKVKSVELDPQESYVLINNKENDPGAYIYRIYENGIVVHTGKFIVIKQ